MRGELGERGGSNKHRRLREREGRGFDLGGQLSSTGGITSWDSQGILLGYETRWWREEEEEREEEGAGRGVSTA